MEANEVLAWLTQSLRRTLILKAMSQPLTARQLSRRLNMRLDSASYVLWELGVYKVVKCLNPQARKSRVYWLTRLGLACRKRYLQSEGACQDPPSIPEVDWDAYGSVCFRHREAVLRSIREPMQPAAIRRRARLMDPSLTMSASNTRDVIRCFKGSGIVRPIHVRGEHHPRYELTDTGCVFRELLIGAGGPG